MGCVADNGIHLADLRLIAEHRTHLCLGHTERYTDGPPLVSTFDAVERPFLCIVIIDVRNRQREAVQTLILVPFVRRMLVPECSSISIITGMLIRMTARPDLHITIIKVVESVIEATSICIFFNLILTSNICIFCTFIIGEVGTEV